MPKQSLSNYFFIIKIYIWNKIYDDDDHSKTLDKQEGNYLEPFHVGQKPLEKQ